MLRFFIPFLVLGLFVPIASMAVVQPISGDLARIGLLPERSFGWNAPQPGISVVSSNVVPDEAKVVIVGDSFTSMGIWQVAAFTQGETFASLGFGQLCSDIGGYFKRIGVVPDTVIIQTVERMFASRLLSSCDRSKLTPDARQAVAQTSELRSTGILYGSFGAKYVLGGLLYLLSPGAQHRSGHSGGVDVLPVPGGCELFSHADCEFALFLGDDRLLPSLPLKEFQSPMIAALKAAGVRRIIVVSIPNKTSIYAGSAETARESDAYLSEFAQRNGVETLRLHESFRASAHQAKDFYWPSDTHLSARGMMVLGEHIGRLFRG